MWFKILYKASHDWLALKAETSGKVSNGRLFQVLAVQGEIFISIIATLYMAKQKKKRIWESECSVRGSDIVRKKDSD